MAPVKEPYRDQIFRGDCRDMADIPDGVIQTCVTSPPYWGLRDYGEGDQLGLEATPEEYVANLVAVFREVRRVLRDDGTVWLNLGDSYAANRTYQVPDGLKAKDLVGIPWRVALALQADGWWLRSDIIWAKPNPMPESVRDRPTRSHEYIFLLTKAKRYYYDADAIREGSITHDQRPGKSGAYMAQRAPDNPGEMRLGRGRLNQYTDGRSRNKWSVWTVTTKPYKGAHFATFPSDLIEPCIKAGTSERGACAPCGSPYRRTTERTAMVIDRSNRNDHTGNRTGASGHMVKPPTSTTTGWEPTCGCGSDERRACLVLDPFMGSGTTGFVAKSLGRDFVGYELNPEYIKLAEERLAPYKNQTRLI